MTATLNQRARCYPAALPGHRDLTDWIEPAEHLIGAWWLTVGGQPGRPAWCRWRPADRHGPPGWMGGFESRAEAEAYGRAYLYTLGASAGSESVR